MTPAGAPTVFVIDDDAGVCAAIHGLLKSVGLRSESFANAQEFLRCRMRRSVSFRPARSSLMGPLLHKAIFPVRIPLIY
jgi:hypothetical protein